MKCVLFVLLMLPPALWGQSEIAPGTILPVRLNSSVRSARDRPGELLSARIMQDVPLGNGSKIKSGAGGSPSPRICALSPACWKSTKRKFRKQAQIAEAMSLTGTRYKSAVRPTITEA